MASKPRSWNGRSVPRSSQKAVQSRIAASSTTFTSASCTSSPPAQWLSNTYEDHLSAASENPIVVTPTRLSRTEAASLALINLPDPYRTLGHTHLEEPDTMDEAYRQHADPSRRKNRSAANLAHLSLAPLTSRLALTDSDETAAIDNDNASNHLTKASRSYIEGKSAPTTPALLSRSPAHVRTPLHPSATTAANLTKSKSAVQLHSLNGPRPTGGSGTQTPMRHHHRTHGSLGMTSLDTATNSDFLERVGALMSDSTRESKGQAWLVSRASSTSLTAQNADDDGHGDPHNADGPWPHARGGSWTPNRSRRSSASRTHSRAGSRVLTPLERGLEGGYFAEADMEVSATDAEAELWAAGPEFVNLDEKLEREAAATSATSMVGREEIQGVEDDEAAIRRLVRNGNTGVGSWIGGIVGWPLFSVDEGNEGSEGEEDDRVEGYDESNSGGVLSRSASERHFEGVTNAPADEPSIPPPRKDEGGWQDAAWLLTVASKVLL